MKFPTSSYVSTDPACPPGRKHLCIAWLPEKVARTDPATGKTRMVWVYGVATFHYGTTAAETEQKLRVWVEEQREAFLKSQIKISRQQKELARKRAKAGRAAEIALFGLEEQPA